MLPFLLRLAALLAVLATAGLAPAAASSFNGGAVSGCTFDGSQTYSCTFLPSDSISISNGYTVNIAGSASINGQSVTISSGGKLNIGGALSLGNQSTINGSVNVAGSVSTDNQSTITGDLTAGGAVAIGNQASVGGDLTAGGDISLDNHSYVGGTLHGQNVVMYNAFAHIAGDAYVYSIILNTKDHVSGSIYCTAPGASGCSCVTDNSHYHPGPSCSGAPPPVTSLDHILITHSGSALTCEPQAVTLTACVDAACSDTYDGAVTVALSPGGGNVVVTGGTANATVSQSTAGQATLTASVSGANPNTCLDTADNSNSCLMTFSDAGFDMQVPDQIAMTSAPPSGTQLPVLTLRALKSNSNNSACTAALTGTRSVNFQCTYNNPASANPAFGASSISVNGTSLAACGSNSSTAVNVTFDSNGQATPTVNYPDVGLVNLRASLTTSGGATLSGSDQFVVGPAGFQITATNKQNNKICSNGGASVTGNLCIGSADENSAVFSGAGQPFDTKVTAVNANGNPAYNFGREASPESFDFSQSLYLPAGGHYSASTPVWGALSGGAQTASNMYVDEVGIAKFQATLHNASYLNSSTLAQPRSTLNVGRFIPDHFTVSFGAPLGLMSCAALNNVPCPAPNNVTGSSFVYAFEPFDMTITAFALAHGANAAATTTNYQGSYAKTTSTSISLLKSDGTASAYTAGSLVWKTGAGAGAAASGNGIPAGMFASGVATSTGTPTVSGTTYDRHPELDFASPAPLATTAATNPVSLYLKVLDSDQATGQALLSFVSGRLYVNNVFGSPTSYMPVSVVAQYWNGTAYVPNPAFVVSTGVGLSTSAAPVNVTFSNCVAKGGGVCPGLPTLPAGTTLKMSSGTGSFNVTPMGGAGATDIVVNPWIYLPSTTGRLTFGVYRSGPVVYMREVF